MEWHHLKKIITARVKKGKSFLFKMIKIKISLGILIFQHTSCRCDSGVMVIMAASQAVDPGSIPGCRNE